MLEGESNHAPRRLANARRGSKEEGFTNDEFDAAEVVRCIPFQLLEGLVVKVGETELIEAPVVGHVCNVPKPDGWQLANLMSRRGGLARRRGRLPNVL
jgi:hypothetical protein